MAAYLVARVDVRDWDRYKEYMRHTPRVIAQHGGRFIVRGAPAITIEGADDPRRLVVIEFPSLERAKAFYDSPAYQSIRHYRDGAGEAQFVIVDGYPDAEWDAAVRESSKLSTDD
ncbi:MAG TPA: DUF1330 domain-containing protein [Candidatus Krumholzibacteria bacterium]|nr:DUF1330 domain-containing protein [Candidatus Krumholzibacteria bacterium]